jgi:hypothetical protein
VNHPKSGRFSEAVSKVLELRISCCYARVAGTLYVPVPKAQEAYFLVGLVSKRAESSMWARINLLSLRDPGV